jgi:DNA-directed RNA polymerase subunit RPC12/RpoP
MEKKIGYCPMCGKEMFITTRASMIHCPNCNHHISLRSWVLPCKCGALPQIYQEGLAKRNIETKEMYFVETYEYSVECEECGASVYTRELDDAVYAWNEEMSDKTIKR